MWLYEWPHCTVFIHHIPKKITPKMLAFHYLKWFYRMSFKYDVNFKKKHSIYISMGMHKVDLPCLQIRFYSYLVGNRKRLSRTTELTGFKSPSLCMSHPNYIHCIFTFILHHVIGEYFSPHPMNQQRLTRTIYMKDDRPTVSRARLSLLE